jgi:hypothetical protein
MAYRVGRLKRISCFRVSSPLKPVNAEVECIRGQVGQRGKGRTCCPKRGATLKKQQEAAGRSSESRGVQLPSRPHRV